MMVELKMDNHRVIDIDKDPITEEIIFEFKEVIKADEIDENGKHEIKTETQAIQRIPVSIIANWSKIVYAPFYGKIFGTTDDDDDS